MMNVWILKALFLMLTSADGSTTYTKWTAYKTEYSKEYNTRVEETRRFEIFLNNLKHIEEHNTLYKNGLESFEKGINQFADMTNEEYVEYRKKQWAVPEPLGDVTRMTYTNIKLPESVDWREKNAVAPVRDQQRSACHSWWAFTATGLVESHYYLQHNKLYNLSAQNLIDCSGPNGNKGCRGGNPDSALQYVKTTGIMQEIDYPYTAREGECKFNEHKSITKVNGYTYVTYWPNITESALQEAVANVGPIGVNVDSSEWQFYKSGIFESKKDSYGMDYAAIVVGYGTENGQDYWLVKNSDGIMFGEEGYIRIARNKRNQCCISCLSLYPNL